MFVYPRIKDFREDKEKKQWEIAKLLGTTQKQYSRLMENAHPREET